MGSDPTGKLEIMKVATPVLLSVPVPSTVAPDLKVTVPVGVPAAEVMVAVKVTACPETDGFCDELMDAAVGALLTFCATTGEVLAAKVESPL